METELLQYIDENGKLPALQRNKYLEHLGVVRLNKIGQVDSVIYKGTWLQPVIEYEKVNRQIDEALKRVKHKKAGQMGVLDTDIDKQVKVDKEIMQTYEKEINPDEIDY